MLSLGHEDTGASHGLKVGSVAAMVWLQPGNIIKLQHNGPARHNDPDDGSW